MEGLMLLMIRCQSYETRHNIYPQLAKITAQFQYENWMLGKEETSN